MPRPEGWEKLNTEEEINECGIEQVRNRMLVDNQVYEAGADAYEEGLKKEVISLEAAERLMWHGNGYLVFIPGGKE